MATQDEYRGVVTTEEEDDNKGLGDAAPGRLLEEGGGSDSDEDETDSDHTEDEGSDSDSYEDGTSKRYRFTQTCLLVCLFLRHYML